MNGDPSVRSLLALGFTALEAEVYVFLVQESPATGYRVAQGIGKPVANTYKAIQSLEKKGAVLVEESANRLCRATPVDELLKRLERRFNDNRQRASQALTSLKPSADDDRIYHLRSPEQVKERCRQMLEDCEHVALLDLFPKALESLRDAIEAAAARGVSVLVKAYEPAEVAGAEVVVTPHGPTILRRWPGQWMNLVVDGRQHLLALLTLDGKGVHQAVWSGSAYLAWVYHSALGCEAIEAAVEQQLENGATASQLRNVIRAHRFLFKPDVPGYRSLLERFSSDNRPSDHHR